MTLPKINLSINPSYHCNFRCNWCYLTPEQLGDTKTIDHIKLNDILAHIQTYRDINHIDLYGGEIGILKKDKLEAITNTIRFYYKDKININTNLSTMNPMFFNPDYYLSVSYDFNARQDHQKVFENMTKLPVDFSVLVLANEPVLKSVGSAHFWENFRKLKHINKRFKSVEVKPYSKNQANQHTITDAQFEDYILELCAVYPGHMKTYDTGERIKDFTFTNELNILDSLDKSYNAYSDDHLYITPAGELAVLDFDKNNNEYFRKVENFDEYIKWTEEEKQKIDKSPICRKCEYKGFCLTEHYRFVENLDNGCNGYKYLLDTYKFRYGKEKLINV